MYCPVSPGTFAQHSKKYNELNKLNLRQNSKCSVVRIYPSPENCTQALFAMLATLRRSACFTNASFRYYLLWSRLVSHTLSTFLLENNNVANPNGNNCMKATAKVQMRCPHLITFYISRTNSKKYVSVMLAHL